MARKKAGAQKAKAEKVQKELEQKNKSTKPAKDNEKKNEDDGFKIKMKTNAVLKTGMF